MVAPKKNYLENKNANSFLESKIFIEVLRFRDICDLNPKKTVTFLIYSVIIGVLSVIDVL